MIHIVFGEEAAQQLQSSFSEENGFDGEIHLVRDDFSVGPIDQLEQAEGWEARRSWWRTVWEGSEFEPAEALWTDDREALLTLCQRLQDEPETSVWIWVAPNPRDVSGYYWLLSYLKPYIGRVQVLLLNNLPFINDKGNLFYPESLSEIPVREFLKARKLAREITSSEFEVDPDEWLRLTADNKGVRVLEGGKKLRQHDYAYFDSDLARHIMPEWQKAARIISQYLAKSKKFIGQDYLLWRLKVMVSMDRFEVQGKLAQMKDFELKNRSKAEP